MSSEVLALKKARGILKGQFTRKVKSLQQSIEREDHLDVVKNLMDSVSEVFQKLETNNDEILNLSVEDSDIESCNNYITELETTKIKSNDLYCRYKDKFNKSQNQRENVHLSVKKLSAPEFGGDIQVYPTFKSDYVRLMEPKYGEDNFVLRSCLTPTVIKSIIWTDSYKDNWARLDDKFGSTPKLVDYIMQTYKNLKPVTEGNNVKFIEMVNIIEKGWFDLQRLGKESEIANEVVISNIERLLPSGLLREWALKRRSLKLNCVKEIFNAFLNFLLNERDTLEYLEQNIRKTTSVKSTVNVCENESRVTNIESVDSFKVFQESQARQNQMFHESLNNLTSMVYNLSLKKSNSESVVNNHNCFCILHNSQTHSLKDCITFKRFNHEQKLETVRKYKLCFSCLLAGHVSAQCSEKNVCNIKTNGISCNRNHHPLLHGNSVMPGAQALYQYNSVAHVVGKDVSLLPISYVYCHTYPICTLYDSGADLSLITHKLANKLGLNGHEIELTIIKVGNEMQKVKSKCYNLALIDSNGFCHNIRVCGLDQITSNHVSVNVNQIAQMFNIDPRLIERPEGNVELLIGIDNCSLMPQIVKSFHNLQLCQNSFGFCIRGTIPSKYLNLERKVNNFSFQVNHIICNSSDISREDNVPIVPNFEDFFLIDMLGTECNPKCGQWISCKCGNCSYGSQLSINEQRELDLIEQGLKYDSVRKLWTATYPWIKDPNLLPNNYRSAFSKLIKTENRLISLGDEYAERYGYQILDMVKRQAASKVSKVEVENYNGPIHFTSHHEIHNSKSSSTPLRIVFNPSASFKGHVLNEYYAKGPDMLNDMLGIFLRFRMCKIGVVGDIKKMYNSILLSTLDQFTHLFLWRDMDTSKDPEIYKMNKVSFGDKPAGAIAILALRKTAEMFVQNYPYASDIIKNDSYVDDIIFSEPEVKIAQDRISEIEFILREGGFTMKEWIMSGQSYFNENLKQWEDREEKVLGICWNCTQDQFKFNVSLKFERKSNKPKNEFSIQIRDFEESFPKILTRRLIASQMASLFDFLGLLTPFTLRGKLLMRELVQEQQSFNNFSSKEIWDVPVSSSIYEKWKSYFFDMLSIPKISFNRCLEPPYFVGKPSLILFSDGSMNFFGACAYIRWQINDGSFCCKLLIAKSRITPIMSLTMPRIELNACVLAVRLREKIQKNLKTDFENVFHFTDSSIVLGQILNESSRFKSYVSVRISEVHRKSKRSEWFWLSSENNVADFTTRILSPSELNSESVWQNGSLFLYQPRNKWPIKDINSFKVAETMLPDIIQNVNSFHIAINASVDISQVIDLKKFNSYPKLLNVSARILALKGSKSFKVVLNSPTVREIQEAEQIWVQHVQSSLGTDWRKQYKRLGPSLNDEGNVVVGERISNWLKDNWNQSEFILLPYNHVFTKLLIAHFHSEDHAGIDSTLAKLQSKFWVPKARKIIKSIKYKCVRCRFLEKKIVGQKMGLLPKERIKVSPPFYHTALDLFGPFFIRNTVKARTTKKVYGVIFNCMVTRAVHLELVEGYDTQSFLVSLKRFIAIRGYPALIHSDQGTQLVAANKELRDMVKVWDKNQLIKFGSHQGMEWSFNKSAEAPFQNGCSESLIRLVKRGLLMSVGNNILTFNELLTAFYEVANLLNERPIGIKPGNEVSLGSYLCPNDLLLGRNNIKVPKGIFDQSDNVNKRYQIINQVVSSFWKKWTRDFFPSLIIRQKWHVEIRNLRKGDIVLVQEKNAIKGSWKLAEVCNAPLSRDGKVRNVSIRYKVNDNSKLYEGKRDSIVDRSVHSLVLILPIEEQQTNP